MSRHPRIERAGKCYRWRRGRLVEIPERWVGHTLHPQTKRKRSSQHPRKQRMREELLHAFTKYGGKPGHPRRWAPRHTVGCRELSENREAQEGEMAQEHWRIELQPLRSADYHEHEERCPEGETPCLLCGRPVSEPWAHVVQLVDGGRFIVPEDAREDVTDPGYVGCWPVGSDCWRRLMAALKDHQPCDEEEHPEQ